MALRTLVPALVGSILLATRLGAQAQTGTITGRVMDGPSQRPLAGVTVRIEGTPRGSITRDDGTYRIVDAPAGPNRVRATRIGYGPQMADVAVVGGGTATADFTMQPQAAVLEGVVVTGYGTQRREAITGSVATVDADAARVGVVTNPEQMIQGRVAGVQIVQNNGEPGAGVQIRVRGGTSISASNEPLYVIDGVPMAQNVELESRQLGAATSSDAQLSRNPLNLLNPADIASITILKDAAATAIYGSRAANGVILIETKKGAAGGASTEYDGYVAMSRAATTLDLLSASEYRSFVTEQVGVHNSCLTANPGNAAACDRVGLLPDRLTGLGTATTDWQDEILRSAATQNHNLAFAGGRGETQYRASVNYMDQKGVAIASGFQRLQGRLNGTHQTFENRLRLNINLTASQAKNDYLAFENTGGFEGGVFHNSVIFNPTHPIFATDPTTGVTRYFELGSGRQSVRNPVAMANQILDEGTTSRILGNLLGEFDIIPGLTASLNFGGDRSDGARRTYLPKTSPIGVEFNGRARQADKYNQSLTLQSLLNYRREIGDINYDVVGGYEYSEYENSEFWIDVRNFLTDAFSFNNLGASSAASRLTFSWAEDSKLVSFFGRANVSFRDRYFLTGVLRRDGSSRFGEGNKWAVFPAISASWRMSKEDWFPRGPFSDLRLRAGYGLQGNPGVAPYASLRLLETQDNARYGWGDVINVGVAPSRNPNPELKWEQTAQFNVALDYGLRNNTISGSLEYYRKDTKDLLLKVFVPQPAAVDTMIRNIGQVENQGVEASLDALAISRRNLTATLGVVFTAERNKVVDLGEFSFIGTGTVSGQGQSNQLAQRIIPGEPLGTFWGPEFVGVGTTGTQAGKQLFSCNRTDADCINGATASPRGADSKILGNANPDFTLGVRSQVNWGQFDLSFLVRSEVGQEVFNNTALVYETKSNVLQNKNFLKGALTDGVDLREPAIFSSRWVESGSFVRLQNLTVGYTFNTLPRLAGPVRNARVYLSGDNLLLLTGYDGYDPEVHVQAGLASRGIDYLTYPRPRTFTAGVRAAF